MKANYIIGLALLSSLFWSCEKVEKLENFPLESPKITMNCNLEENKDIVVEVTRSLSVIDGAQLKPITDATVKILYVKNGTNISYTQQGSNDNQNGIEVYKLSVKPEPGIMYRIEVSSKKYGNVWAESTLPQAVSLDTVVQKIVDSSYRDYRDFGLDYVYLSINDANSSIKFKDNQNEENFYVLSQQIKVNKEISEGISINSNIPGAEIINGLIFFNDQTFNGKEYTIQYSWSSSVRLRDIDKDKIRATYTLTSVTKDYYQYLVSYNYYLQNQDNPFADPVQVYNNIVGGYGIFAGSASSYLSNVIK